MNRKHRGFTLIELVVTMILAVVVLGIGVPSMVGMMRANSVISLSNELLADLQLARSEAIKRNEPVSVCAANTALDACANGSEWQGGWIVFVDDVGDANGSRANNEEILRTHSAISTGEMVIDLINADNLSNHIIFQADGYPVNSAGQAPKGVFRFCNGDEVDRARGVRVSRSGRLAAGVRVSSCS